MGRCDTATLASLQSLVGLHVEHRTWGAGTVTAVVETGAPSFPAGVAFFIRFDSASERGTPFTIEDFWGGVRLSRPTLSALQQGAEPFLDALLSNARNAQPQRPRTAFPTTQSTPQAAPHTFEAPVKRAPQSNAQALTQSRQAGSSWAQSLLTRDDWILVDTETTGFDSGAEVIDLAILDRHGNVLLNTLLRPQRSIPAAASRVHGLTDRHVREAQTFPQIWPQLRAILANRALIAYNVQFDARLLEQTASRYGITLMAQSKDCVMKRYAEYRIARAPHGARRAYSLEDACRYHALPIGGHRALADCRATLELLKVMATK